jgi:hypothetical protein
MVGFAFLRHDSAIIKRAWMALAAPSVRDISCRQGFEKSLTARMDLE